MKRRILVLEDEALIAMDIEATLQDAGFDNVIVCHRSCDALAEIAKDLPDFAFLDLNLGNKETSIEVARELARQSVRFTILSGYTNATVALPDDLTGTPRMTKPFKSSELISRVTSEVGAPA